MDSQANDPFPIDRAELLRHARYALKDKPKNVRGHEDECVGNVCIEPHLIAHNGCFSDKLEGEHYDIFAHWDLHVKRYVHVYASFPRILDADYTVNLDDALKTDA